MPLYRSAITSSVPMSAATLLPLHVSLTPRWAALRLVLLPPHVAANRCTSASGLLHVRPMDLLHQQ